MLEGKFMNEFLNEYATAYGFEVPIDAEILIKQIHPDTGNMSRIDKFIPVEFIEDLFQTLLVASFEKLQGQTLLSNEICSLGYWKYQDKGNDGQLSFPQFTKLLETFEYEVKDLGDLRKQFPSLYELYPEHLENNPEYVEGKESNIRIGFDVFRYIYLERNL